MVASECVVGDSIMSARLTDSPHVIIQSVSLSVCQSVSLSVCQSVSLSVCQSVSLSVCQSVSVSQWVCLSVSLWGSVGLNISTIRSHQHSLNHRVQYKNIYFSYWTHSVDKNVNFLNADPAKKTPTFPKCISAQLSFALLNFKSLTNVWHTSLHYIGVKCGERWFLRHPSPSAFKNIEDNCILSTPSIGTQVLSEWVLINKKRAGIVSNGFG